MNLARVFAARFLFLACVFSPAAAHAEPESLRILFWNVRNLFDTHNDPRTQDNDFTPTGREKWTEERLSQKLAALSGILKTINPDIAGLAEVENIDVLRRLAGMSGYPHVYLVERTDQRGIDIGVISKIPLSSVENKGPGRGLLRFQVYGAHIAFAHWKSKRGGARQTSAKRVAAAKFAAGLEKQMLLMGDFNESPGEEARMILEKAGFVNVVQGPCSSYFSGRKKQCMDGAYLRSECLSASAEIARPQGLWLGRSTDPAVSDHLPVVALLKTCSPGQR